MIWTTNHRTYEQICPLHALYSPNMGRIRVLPQRRFDPSRSWPGAPTNVERSEVTSRWIWRLHRGVLALLGAQRKVVEPKAKKHITVLCCLIPFSTNTIQQVSCLYKHCVCFKTREPIPKTTRCSSYVLEETARRCVSSTQSELTCPEFLELHQWITLSGSHSVNRMDWPSVKVSK